MKVLVINTGKSPLEAQQQLQTSLDSINIDTLISMTDSGMRIILVYTEKTLPKNTKVDIIKGIENNKGVSDAPKDTDNKRRRKPANTKISRDK